METPRKQSMILIDVDPTITVSTGVMFRQRDVPWYRLFQVLYNHHCHFPRPPHHGLHRLHLYLHHQLNDSVDKSSSAHCITNLGRLASRSS